MLLSYIVAELGRMWYVYEICNNINRDNWSQFYIGRSVKDIMEHK